MMLALHLIIAIALLLLTQVGGVIYFVAFILGFMARKLFDAPRIAGIVIFLVALVGGWYAAFLYLGQFTLRSAGTYPLACTTNEGVKSAHKLYCYTFRNYANLEVNAVLTDVAAKMPAAPDGSPNIIVMDAGFPFPHFAFPMLPHAGHRDGFEVDIALWYENGVQPSALGYGAYSNPVEDGPAACPDEQGDGPLARGPVPPLDVPRTSAALTVLGSEPKIESVESAAHVMALTGQEQLLPPFQQGLCDSGPLSDRIRLRIKAPL